MRNRPVRHKSKAGTKMWRVLVSVPEKYRCLMRINGWQNLFRDFLEQIYEYSGRDTKKMQEIVSQIVWEDLRFEVKIFEQTGQEVENLKPVTGELEEQPVQEREDDFDQPQLEHEPEKPRKKKKEELELPPVLEGWHVVEDEIEIGSKPPQRRKKKGSAFKRAVEKIKQF